MRRLYAVLTAAGAAETVNTHVNITTLYTVGAEIAAHLIFIAGVYGLALIDAAGCGLLGVGLNLFVKLFIGILILFV